MRIVHAIQRLVNDSANLLASTDGKINPLISIAI